MPLSNNFTEISQDYQASTIERQNTYLILWRLVLGLHELPNECLLLVEPPVDNRLDAKNGIYAKRTKLTTHCSLGRLPNILLTVTERHVSDTSAKLLSASLEYSSRHTAFTR